jgi:hypothetical protein
MDMKILNCIRIALFLLVLLPGLNSCESYYTDDFLRNNDEKLCNELWERKYMVDQELCTQQLEFLITAKGGKGTEIYSYQRKGGKDSWDTPYTTMSYGFSWEWTDDEREGIIIEHTMDGTLYFDNVWVRAHYLSGNLDGEEVTFYKVE